MFSFHLCDFKRDICTGVSAWFNNIISGGHWQKYGSKNHISWSKYREKYIIYKQVELIGSWAFFGPSGGYSYRPCRAVNFLCHTQTKLTDKQPTFEVTKQSVIYDRVNYTWNICINQFWKWQNGMTVWERRTDTTYEQQEPKEKTTHTKKYDRWAAEHWNQNITHHKFFLSHAILVYIW